ncbi:Di-copper centre-containing protein [Schizopora paradoxa]|uniref:tyrosinase n=1 Tax=Schizopora paradoxa TaxID=27342 RepID=A0A0H2RSH5_9AGAM|nr:Di-copper centre-containing protein [Schizopora paradoxa]
MPHKSLRSTTQRLPPISTMTAPHTTVTGPPKQSGVQTNPPTRKEIYDLIKDERQFSLYVQALDRLTKAKEDVSVSHYQVGGIHGLPYVRWEDAGNKTPAGTWEGYCHHGSVLFPTWHRPYMSLYEQLLNKHAQDIAKDMPDEWKKSASELRQPYWDWAINGVPPPEVIEYKTLDILHPDGSKKPFPNPLIYYTFQTPLSKEVFGDFAKWSETVRKPTANGITLEDWKSALEGIQKSTKREVFDLLLRVDKWEAFAHHIRKQSITPVSSLETIHDKMHVAVGGGGFMGDTGVAGFDPIFYLHHCNVDRVLALWQAIHPKVWVSEGVAMDGGNWTQADGEPVNSTTGLAPFWSPPTSGGNEFWTSDQSRDFEEQLNFTYPEFVGVDPQDRQLKVALQCYKLYWSAETSKITTEAIQSKDFNPITDLDIDLYEWKAGIEVEKYAIDSSFSVCVFLLAPGVDSSVISDTNSTEWYSSPYFAGQTSIFINSAGKAKCGNCQAQAADNAVVQGFMHLNDSIKLNGNLTPAEENDNEVHEYLKKHIVWKACKANGEIIPLPSIPSLKVTVYSTSSSIPESNIPGGAVLFSGFKTVRPRQEVTSGKVGGF